MTRVQSYRMDAGPACGHAPLAAGLPACNSWAMLVNSCHSHLNHCTLDAAPGLHGALNMLTFVPVAVLQASVREVKRLDSISRSPVYSSIGEALNGQGTIRAYK